jgi:Capsule assembly protein Wzi
MRGACYFSHARSATAVLLDGRRSPCSRERVPLAPLLLAAHLVLAAAPPASPSLPPGHWAVDAARRLHELGLAPDFLPAQRAVPLLVVGRTLAEAADRARETAPAYAPLASAWAARFVEEFSGTSEGQGEGAGLRLLSAHATLGYQDGATSELPSASPPLPAALHLEAPRPDPFAELGAAASLGPHLAAGLTARATPWQVDLPFAELVAAVGPVALSIGRAPLRYGPNEVGGVVATGATLDRVEAMTTAPIRLPGVLAALGDFALDVAVARFDEPRHPYHPLLWDMQLSWRPHPRLTLGALRGVMFGGALWEGIPTSQIPLALLGVKNYRENNVYSGTIEYLLPTEALLPLTAKLEWGTDDNPGAAFSWPGLVAGLSSPMLPGLPVAVGFEYAYFGKGPFGYHDPFPWYSHGQYVGGWATGETPLGDPLGGNGRAYRLVASTEPFDGRLRLTAAGWLQDRFRDNLYAPDAAGRSLGGRLGAELRAGRWAAELSGEGEHGSEGWSRRSLRGALTVFF